VSHVLLVRFLPSTWASPVPAQPVCRYGLASICLVACRHREATAFAVKAPIVHEPGAPKPVTVPLPFSFATDTRGSHHHSPVEAEASAAARPSAGGASARSASSAPTRGAAAGTGGAANRRQLIQQLLDVDTGLSFLGL